ncbi:hypothetical protein RJT34_14507 [Clitoria ternatea]|uniref:Protein kinase domain-containing protein n=1 Tax=Clitoria ternatea TaxID=43366 RepID=A0AAN9JQW3_CLITE
MPASPLARLTPVPAPMVAPYNISTEVLDKPKLSTWGGIFSSLGSIILLLGLWRLYKVVKKKLVERRRERFFKQNGGLLLEQRLSSGEVNVDKVKLFSLKDLHKATDRFNVNRVLGKGGQGTVYKGMLVDGKIIAVKKFKVEGNIEEFINEFVILSQINHRNVVKLLGCCLETEIPLLVYEFIPNGNLFEYLHEQNEELPMTWDMRLRIATEVAGALFYLHSAASQPIYHRDIKSTNILLDEKYKAKIADFGTSRMVSIEATHLTTVVQEVEKKHVIAVANIASRFLELKGKKRPTMKEVTLELEGIRKVEGMSVQGNQEELELVRYEDRQSWATYSTISNARSTLETELSTLEVMPIILNTS